MSDINHADRAHSEIGASSSDRWMNCPASVSLSRGIEDSASIYAEEGTAAHELAEHCIENNIPASECVGMRFNKCDLNPEGFEVDEAMANHVQLYVDLCNEFMEDDYDCSVEDRFVLEPVHKNAFGSNDFCAKGIGDKAGHLVIADLKYGKGKDVQALNNPQLVYYALGAFYEFDDIYEFDKITMIICQPRVSNPIRKWEIARDELIGWENKFKKAVKEVYSDEPRIESGSHCTWCKAKATCPNLKHDVEVMVQNKFDETPVESEFTLPEVSDLDMNTMLNVLKNGSLISDWLKAVASRAQNLLEDGVEVPGYKLVKRKAHRKITDPKALINEFEFIYGDELYEPKKLKSVGKLEKVIGKKNIADFLHKPDTGNTIAPESDSRPSVSTMNEQLFNDADENDFSTMEF